MVTFNEPQLRQMAGAPLARGLYHRLIVSDFADAIDEIGPSMLHGGRYNPAGEFGVLYLTVSIDCGMAEMVKRVFGNHAALPPLSVGDFQVSLQRHLDLTDAEIQKELGVNVSKLTDPADYGLTQRLARSARQAGF